MGIAATTFDPARKGSSVTLSGGNLTATVSSGTGSVLSSNMISGPTYFEMVMGATLSGSCGVGVGRTDMSLSALVGAGTTSIGYNKDGAVKVNNVTLATIATYAANDNIGVAVDTARKLIWFRVNGGNWNNDVIGNQNPVGAIGGISFATPATPCAAAWGGSATASATANLASGSWAYSAPTGFSQMNTLGASAFNGDVASPAAAFTQYGEANGTGDAPEFSIRATLAPLAGDGGTISGVVQENGTPVSGKTVHLYDANDGILLGTDVSDGSGNFSIPALGRADVYAVALDPTYQALIYDQLTPV